MLIGSFWRLRRGFWKNVKRLCIIGSLLLIVWLRKSWIKSSVIGHQEVPEILFDGGQFKCSSDSWAISTCGCRGDSRGHHQSVVGFSLYGNFSDKNIHERYVKAMGSVVDQAREFYPDWIVRIYTTANNSRILEKTFRRDKHVDICVVESALDTSRPHLLKADQLFPMVWRFLPLLDPTVDFFMSRDADSYIFEREIDAVEEWLDAETAFHVMRDHMSHCNGFCKFVY